MNNTEKQPPNKRKRDEGENFGVKSDEMEFEKKKRKTGEKGVLSFERFGKFMSDSNKQMFQLTPDKKYYWQTLTRPFDVRFINENCFQVAIECDMSGYYSKHVFFYYFETSTKNWVEVCHPPGKKRSDIKYPMETPESFKFLDRHRTCDNNFWVETPQGGRMFYELFGGDNSNTYVRVRNET